MQYQAYLYRDPVFNGRIYVKIVSDTKLRSASVMLLKNGEVSEYKSAEKNFVMFSKQECGTYKSTVRLVLEDGSLMSVESNQLKVTTAPVPRKKQPAIKPLNAKGSSVLIDGIEHYLLELSLAPGALPYLKSESVETLPYTHELIANALEKVDLRAFWEDEEDQDDDGGLYRITTKIAKDDVLVLVQELEKLYYVNYCAALPEMVGQDADVLVAAGPQQDSDVDTANVTPDFEPRQGYLMAGRGMNIHKPGIWERPGRRPRSACTGGR